ncbi:ras-related protein Ral-a-like [Anabrus simplex]|uniref:ras-related protein Ral-a-like n=1 Tax=Anabrus simplex TaxID=316456 RepID=UPI0035A2F222
MLKESGQEPQIPLPEKPLPEVPLPEIPIPKKPPTPLPLYKIVLVGSAGVGKTALALQFMYNEFQDEYEPTKSGEYRKTVLLDGREVDIDVTDTAGRQENPDSLNASIRRGEGFLCVFSLVDEDSFKATQDFREKILRLRSVNIPFILVGNKCDLKGKPAVSSEAVTKKAIQWDVPYVETSAKTCHNVEKVFFDLARKIEALKTVRKLPDKPKKDEKPENKPLCQCPCCEIS